MAINRNLHPITDEELISFLERQAEHLQQDAVRNARFGDTRPELFRAAAKRIREAGAGSDPAPADGGTVSS